MGPRVPQLEVLPELVDDFKDGGSGLKSKCHIVDMNGNNDADAVSEIDINAWVRGNTGEPKPD